MKKTKYIFKDIYSPSTGTYKCGSILQDTLLNDGINVKVHIFETDLYADKNGKYSQKQLKNKHYKLTQVENDFPKLEWLDPKMKELQAKVHPEKSDDFGLYYVYIYDYIPTDEQLSSSFLEYVCCEEVEFNSEIQKLKPKKGQRVQWKSSNKGGNGKNVTLNPKPSNVTKNPGPVRTYSKVEQDGFTRINKPKNNLPKGTIVGIFTGV
jgi:hypothetical protein